MSRIKSTLNRIERALGSPRRNIVISVVLILVGVGALLIGNAHSNRLAIDRAYRDGIRSVVTHSSELLAQVFGEDGLVVGAAPWAGLRVYLPELDEWMELDELDRAGEGLNGAGLPARVVVLVHGLDEPGGIWDQLAPALSVDGHTVVRFEYPNDQAIALSGAGFLRSFDELSLYGVGSIDLVCHSMGGLVARDAITRDGFGEQNIVIERLVTIGTPHGGSPWARLRAVAEIREQVQRWVGSDDLDPKLLLGFARDGVGQAGTDLLPGSDFLVALDQRAMPEGLKITCIVGRAVPEFGSDLGSMLADGVLSDLIGERDASAVLGGVEKLSAELGDGVVPMSSAVLDGVDDVVVLNANHRGLIRSVELGEMVRSIGGLAAGDEPPGIEVVLDRLRRE